MEKGMDIMTWRHGESFSRRHGFQGENPTITLWDEAPSDFRFAVLQIANDDCGLGPSKLRDVICRITRRQPDSSNWSEYPNIWNEVQTLFQNCKWYDVFNVIEIIWVKLQAKYIEGISGYQDAQDYFSEEVNVLMADFGIGWKLEEGEIKARGEESYETYLKSTEESLEKADMPTALAELKEAIRDVSRRPSPDTTGAIQHATAALECIARHIAGDPKTTLGSLALKHPDLFPKPMDKAINQMWGYASENARHGREGNAPTREDALLVVGISAALVNYLLHKAES